jgi:hypothetical protein
LLAAEVLVPIGNGSEEMEAVSGAKARQCSCRLQQLQLLIMCDTFICRSLLSMFCAALEQT